MLLHYILPILRMRKTATEVYQRDILSYSGKKNVPWWGKFSLNPGQAKFWRIGNVIICIDRTEQAWNIACCEANRIDNFQLKTFACKSGDDEVCLRPILADRPLASRLARPVYIPAQEEILLYVSSPVWVYVETVKPSITLGEYPSFALSDTWFGQNTIQGELCYAGQTFCSTTLDECPNGPDRIISPMLIVNHSKSPLALENISVPLPYLSVYADPYNHLWTEQLNLIREQDDKPEVRVAKGPPRSANKLTLVGEPRINISTSLGLKNLLHSLIGYRSL